MKYIDVDKLNAEIERLNSLVPYENNDRHEEGLHDAYKAVKNVIASLQQEMELPDKYQTPDWLFKEQEQIEVDLEKEIDNYMDPIQPWEVQEAPFTSLEKCARHFFELGMSVMRKRITNPDYNQKVIEKMKSEYPMDKSKARKEESK